MLHVPVRDAAAASPESPFTIVALVATHDRPELLASRALASIGRQTRRPDLLVVVDDSSPQFREANRRAAVALRAIGVDVAWLPNRRTPGAAGAWNTGLDEIRRRFADPTRVLAAFLDDDDAWSDDHLEHMTAVLRDADAVVGATPILRVTSAEDPGRVQFPPDALRADEFLAGNPHVQASNLVARLDVLLEAGTFDENLPSCTDRDLLVRIARLPGVSYVPSYKATVRHFAEKDRERLSLPGSTTKRVGLERFYAKHRTAMSEEVARRFRDRAREVFGVKIPHGGSRCATKRDAAAPERATAATEGTLCLAVGVIVNADQPQDAERLARELAARCGGPRVGSFEILLLENGSDVVHGAARFAELVERLRADGIGVYAVTRERQVADAAAGAFGSMFRRPPGRASIAAARRMLQAYLAHLLRGRPHVVAAVFDEDLHCEALVGGDGPCLETRDIDLVGLLLRRPPGSGEILLGIYTGDAPVPAAATLRVQLVDLDANLRWLAGLDPEEPLPSRIAEVLALRQGRADCHYDLSRRETDRLETPFPVLPAHPGESVRAALRRLAELFPDVLAGVQITRPLFIDESDPPKEHASVERGGITFCEGSAFADVPNLAPTVDGVDLRRSDMVWATLQRNLRGRRVVSVPIAFRQDRTSLPRDGLDFEKLLRDIQGYAVRSAMEDVADQDTRSRDAFLRQCRKYAIERWSAYEQSFPRARGLAKTIAAFLRDAATGAWWHADPEGSAAAASLAKFCDEVLDQLSQRKLVALRERVHQGLKAACEAFFDELGARVDDYAAAVSDHAHVERMSALFADERRAIAVARARRAGAPSDLRVLGAGAEGVVLTDGTTAWKVIDRWKPRDVAAVPTFLRSLVGRVPAGGPIPRVLSVAERAAHTIVVSELEDSQPYSGGHGPALVALLHGLRDLGICCRNVKPENLRVVGDRVVLVDLGADIVPWTPHEFRKMAIRAWLTWRWHHRPDLAEVMRRSRTDQDIPEMDAFERFWTAVEPRDVHAELRTILVEEVTKSHARTVLDYGCGNGGLALALAARGLDAWAFDPDGRLRERWSVPSNVPVHFVAERGEIPAGRRFDAVVCSRVLCVLHEREYRESLADLRRLVQDSGRVVVAICHPLYTLGGDTPFQRRCVPAGAVYDTVFDWTKVLAKSGRERTDVHRPLDRLRRDLLRIGLVIESTRETETVDLGRFEPASDFLVLVLRPVEVAADVTLMIKACAMEAATIERHVEHLVSSLGSPTAFAETLLVLDSRAQGFARQWAEGDVTALDAAAHRLVRRGLVDRVVRGPTEVRDVEALNERWFGVRASDTHAANGSQVASTLAGFEACRTRYVLQTDADAIVVRRDPQHDYLREMVSVLETEARALTVSMNIVHAEDRPYADRGADGPWAVEVRCGLFDLHRLRAGQPYQNGMDGRALRHGWYRAVSASVREGQWSSWRGGSARTAYVHPPNTAKRDADLWWTAVDRAGRGLTPDVQRDAVELRGDIDDWVLPKRAERFVFVICGRNVPAGRLRRCLDSLRRQRSTEWGAVVIDDASDAPYVDAFQQYAHGLSSRATVLQNSVRRGALANLVLAVRHACTDPESVIVTLDLDDALLGGDVVDRLTREYDAGADATVGSMLRTDKHRRYSADLLTPRAHRGGNVWQHLRSFKKRLFDAIPDEVLRPDGRYPAVATDWAYMLPVVEGAERPVHIAEPLYFYEPSGQGKTVDRTRRDALIAAILDHHARTWSPAAACGRSA